jgi:nicotinate-nucleotide pyrophosphorylase (carboxylating)
MTGGPLDLEALVAQALAEDGAEQDVTTQAVVPPEILARGALLAKQELVVSGLEATRTAFRMLDAAVSFASRVAEGDRVSAGTVLAHLSGRAHGFLAAERVALNFVQRLSGVATLTRRFVEAVAGTKTQIRDTRKTTPLLRALEKRAVAAGGGVPHRAGLTSGILLKDNHIRLAKSAGEATRRAVASAAGRPVEVEVERIDQIGEVLAAGATMVLLDNFTPEDVRNAVRLIAGKVPVEVSGGVTLASVRSYAEAGPDYIAVGALTHSAPAVDICFEIEPA